MLNHYTGSPGRKEYNFDIVLEWHWNSSLTNPNSIQVMCAPVVADLNNDKIPDIIFHSYEDKTYLTNGTLRAISGNGSGELFTVTDYTMKPGYNPAVGDIDNDGRPDIVTVTDTNRIIVFEHDGSLKWQSNILTISNQTGSITLADIDEDGSPEVILGNYVLNNDGSIKWTGAGGNGKYSSYVVNLDLVGNPELVAGGTAYRSNGSIYWQNAGLNDGFSAAANLDADPYPEIVIVYNGNLYILEHDGTTKLGPIFLFGSGGGPPSIADVDNDGDPEICISLDQLFVVLEVDGTKKWSVPIEDISSKMLSSTAFDFEADGKIEILHADQKYFRIFSGQDGTVLFEMYIESGTIQEFPVVVDVDNDQSAEIIIVSNEFWDNDNNAEKGILVFGDAHNSSVNTRKIWNQHNYFITNINDNCTIPQFMQNNWDSYNNFRQNPGL